MRLFFKIQCQLVTLAFLIVSFSGLSHAQGLRNGEAVGDWRFDCVAITEDENRCVLTQVIMYEGLGQPLARISFARAEIASQVMVSIVAPLGVEIPYGASLVSGEDALQFPFLFCTAEGCLARAPVEGEVVRNFFSSDDLAILLSLASAESATVIPASARGLLEALERASFGITN